MKLDTATILKIIERKGVSWFGAFVMGMVLCAMDDQTRDLVKRYVGLLTGGGGGALVLSVILSMLNDGKKVAAIEQLEVKANENLHKAPEGYVLVKTGHGEIVSP